MPAARPLIGLTTATYTTKEAGEPFLGLNPHYSQAVELAGGLPVQIPVNVSPETLRAIYERVDGLLIPGGGDVAPYLYGGLEHPALRGVNPVRDRAEITLIRWAAAEDKPVLGICRGQQVMNVALGGTLYEDLSGQYEPRKIQHDAWRQSPREQLVHSITLQAGSALAAALGVGRADVNSMHHQAVRALAPELAATALAPDGLIEGVERPGSRFFLAVQWHPEDLVALDEAMRRLFASFVAASRNGRI